MHPQGISLIQLFEINFNLPAHISRPHTLSQASSKKTTARWVGWGKVLSQPNQNYDAFSRAYTRFTEEQVATTKEAGRQSEQDIRGV